MPDLCVCTRDNCEISVTVILRGEYGNGNKPRIVNKIFQRLGLSGTLKSYTPQRDKKRNLSPHSISDNFYGRHFQDINDVISEVRKIANTDADKIELELEFATKGNEVYYKSSELKTMFDTAPPLSGGREITIKSVNYNIASIGLCDVYNIASLANSELGNVYKNVCNEETVNDLEKVIIKYICSFIHIFTENQSGLVAGLLGTMYRQLKQELIERRKRISIS